MMDKVFDIDPVKDTSLVGYFQTERYFKHIEDKVREEFQFKDSIADDCENIIETFFDNPIALHIRRGDYLITLCLNHHNPTLKCDIMKGPNESEPDRQVVVFTDDLSDF